MPKAPRRQGTLDAGSDASNIQNLILERDKKGYKAAKSVKQFCRNEPLKE